jgi:SAM-dependent methyltransferase
VSQPAEFWDGILGASAPAWGRAPSPAVDLLAAQLAPGARVLVPGCGYGRNALALAERGYEVTAYDYSAAGIARARAEAAHPNVAYVVRDALASPPPAEQYDGILCHFFLHLFRAPQRQQIVASLRATLAPGGWLLATGLSTRCPFFGNGAELEPDTWSNPGWAPVHFYTPATLAAELAPLTVLNATERDEPEDKPSGPTLTPAVYVLARAPA